MKTLTMQDVNRREARCRRMAHIWTARGYIACLRSVRLAGVADNTVQGGCGATLELHYRFLIQSSRDMARQIQAWREADAEYLAELDDARDP